MVVNKLLYTSDVPHFPSLCSAAGDASGVVKVAEWQETRYGIDSGIQSRANTINDDDYTTKHYTMTTTVTTEQPGKETTKGPNQPVCI